MLSDCQGMGILLSFFTHFRPFASENTDIFRYYMITVI